MPQSGFACIAFVASPLPLSPVGTLVPVSRNLRQARNCGRKAASCDRRHGVRTCSVQTLIASLRISPGLAATGSREIQPVSRALFRARDALTGIKRADTANEIQYDPAKSNSIFCRWFAGRERNSTTRLTVDAVTMESNWKFPRSRSSFAGQNLSTPWTAGAPRCAPGLHRRTRAL